MTTHIINQTDMFTTRVTIRESDKYSQSAYVKFTRGYDVNDATGCNEMFLSVDQLDSLADTFKAEAGRIRSQQDTRHSEAAI